MKKIILLLSLVSVNAFAAHPPYNCSAEELKAVFYREPIYSSVVASGRILSVIVTDDGYQLKTEKCVVDVSKIYTGDEGENRPCPTFELSIKQSVCQP